MATPFTTDQSIGIALSHQLAGRLADAEAIYRQVISTAPDNVRALDLFGVLCVQLGKLPTAITTLRRTVALAPNVANYRSNLGEALRLSGLSQEAVEQFGHAVRLKPDLAMAHNNMGIALADLGRLDEAVAAYKRCLELQPDLARCHGNLGNALAELERYDEALIHCEKAIELSPQMTEGHNNLGALLALMSRTDDAIASFRRAIELNPHFADAYSSLGNALATKGRMVESVNACRHAVELSPKSVQSHWNFAVALLRAGDLRRGFQEYEWRWVIQEQYPFPKQRFKPSRFAQPPWTGGPAYGLTILLHAEQGFGDTIHFVRYVPMVAERGAKVILEVPPELRRLLGNIPGASQVISRGDPIPPVHQHCPLMTLPLAFGTEWHTIPANIPYVTPNAELVQAWAERLKIIEAERDSHEADVPRKIRIGLCWAGSPTHHEDRIRSMSLVMLAPLATDRAVFYSLQKGPAAEQALQPPAGMQLVDFSDLLTDFAETAALVANLDLVIAVDTSVAHLAGAMGKPVWVFLRALSDWRWVTERTDTPWYPTMRLFRQEMQGDWNEPVARMAEALVAWAARP